jgi:hypothetical protein
MALGRWVLTATVTVTPDALAAVTAGEPGMGGAAGFGNAATASPPTSGKFGLWAGTYQAGTVIYADSALSTPLTGPQALYQAIGPANLRAFVQGQDDTGHAALAN